MKRFLITTALEQTWRDDEPVLFLGEWCRLYNRKSVWSDLDAEVVPYHWDDREKLHRDYLYLQALHEELLQELSSQLNTLHGVEYSLRYWRILVGVWLGLFVQMLFDRWVMLEQAVKGYSISGVRILDVAPEEFIPNDMGHFMDMFASDEWNEVIYGQLLENWTAVPVKKVRASRGRLPARPALPLPRRLKRKLAQVASVVSRWFVRENEAFFIATYLPIKLDWTLQWRLGQIPKLWREISPPKTEVEWERRQWKMSGAGVDDFAAIARAMIPRHIPVSYLEGYPALQAFGNNLPWPKKPRLIFTSNSYFSNDVFKAWAAEKVSAGTLFVGGQHGGVFGAARWIFEEDHQISIFDRWLSWGWNDQNTPQVKPAGFLKMIGRNLNWDPKGGALMVEMAMPRYSYLMLSGTVATQWLGYFEDQCRFMTALPQRLREQVLVRLYSHDYGWCQKQRWRDRFPKIRLDDGVLPIAGLIEKSRLYLATYNSTTFLESLAMNVPTIMFWNPNHWELRSNAVPYFEKLKKAGIFHESPESAACQMVKVWDDVDGWWNQTEVQEARLYFCDHFARMPNDPVHVLEEALTMENGN